MIASRKKKRGCFVSQTFSALTNIFMFIKDGPPKRRNGDW